MMRGRFHTRINTGLLFLLAASTLIGWAHPRLSPESPLQYADMAVLASRERRPISHVKLHRISPAWDSICAFIPTTE
jgi:hypothetical protein